MRKWEIEEIYPDEDFQCRILERGVMSGGQYGDPRDQIIVGEPSKRGGRANIHDKEIAELIVSAPKLKEQNALLVLGILQEKNKVTALIADLKEIDGKLKDCIDGKINRRLGDWQQFTEQAITKATNL